MRRIAVLVLAVALMTTVAFAEEMSIGLGDYNADVIRLHQKLRELGIYRLRPESPWGPASVESLKLIQGVLGLEETGEIRSAEEYEAVLAVNLDGYNLATGTENTVIVEPDGASSWCKPYEFYTTSELGLALLKFNEKFTVSFKWKATDVDTAVDAGISFRYTGAEKTWYAAVGHFAIPVGDSQGHCEVIFTPTDEMREHGTGWLIGDIGSENRGMQITLSNFQFTTAWE